MLATEKQPAESLKGHGRTRTAGILLLSAIATTGPSAGFMYLWKEVMIPGLAVVGDAPYIQAMNEPFSSRRRLVRLLDGGATSDSKSEESANAQ